MISVILSVLFGAVVGADAYTTKEGLGGGIEEGNPLLLWFKRKFGWVGFWAAFLALAGIGGGCIEALYDWRPWAGIIFTLVAVLWRGVVVYHNFKILKGEK